MRKRYRKSLFSGVPVLLATILFMSSMSQTAYATEIQTANDPLEELASASFSVRIPKHITLNGSRSGTAGADYNVSVVAENMADGWVVEIAPDANFYMSSTGKEDIEAVVTQEETAWGVENGETVKQGTILVEKLSSGKWNGSFSFSIGLCKPEQVTFALRQSDSLLEEVLEARSYNESLIEELQTAEEERVMLLDEIATLRGGDDTDGYTIATASNAERSDSYSVATSSNAEQADDSTADYEDYTYNELLKELERLTDENERLLAEIEETYERIEKLYEKLEDLEEDDEENSSPEIESENKTEITAEQEDTEEPTEESVVEIENTTSTEEETTPQDGTAEESVESVEPADNDDIEVEEETETMETEETQEEETEPELASPSNASPS